MKSTDDEIRRWPESHALQSIGIRLCRTHSRSPVLLCGKVLREMGQLSGDLLLKREFNRCECDAPTTSTAGHITPPPKAPAHIPAQDHSTKRQND